MFTVFMALSLMTPAEPPKEKEKDLPEAAQKEVQKLQGKWKAVRLARNGMEYIVKKDDPEVILEFKGRKWIFTGIEKAEIVAIDATADPKCLDMKSLEKGRNGVVEEGIFKIDGDTLTVCWYQGEGKNRPTKFDVPKDKDTVLAVFERVPEKPKK